MPETTPLIKAALNLRGGAGFDVYGKFVMAHKIQVAIGICSIVAVAIAVKIFIWIKERNELVKVPVKVENNDNR